MKRITNLIISFVSGIILVIYSPQTNLFYLMFGFIIFIITVYHINLMGSSIIQLIKRNKKLKRGVRNDTHQ